MSYPRLLFLSQYQIHLCYHFHHWGSKWGGDLHQLLFIFQYIQISSETLLLFLLFFIRPIHVRVNLPIHLKFSFSPYACNPTCLPINPCSAQPLKCSSHWLPKSSIIVKTVIFNDQASHQQFYIILFVCNFIIAYYFTITEDNLSKNPCKSLCLPLLPQMQLANTICFNI